MNVLFLCTGNSARSIMAEALLNTLGKGRFRAFSAGSRPVGRVHPNALELLAEAGLDTAGLGSKGWETYSGATAPRMDLVITVCDRAAGETCPVWPGRPVTAHWGFMDPAGVNGTEAEIGDAFRRVYKQIERCIELLVDLPIENLDSAELTRLVRDIGRRLASD